MEPATRDPVIADTVRLAIDAPAPVAERAAFTITQLLASACVAVGRTGSVILPWPNPSLPFDPAAWAEPPTAADADPVAYAFHRLGGAHPCTTPEVDAIRERIHAWARAERLRTESPWPDAARCAVALLHVDRRPPPGLRDRLRRRDPLALWTAIAATDRAWGAQTRLLSPPAAVRAELVTLGLADDASAVAIEPAGTFVAGTAFPYRAYDIATDRPAAATLPVAARGDADIAIRAIADAARTGGGVGIVLEHRSAEDANRYDAVLRSARLNGAWCAPPAAIAARLPL